MWSPIVTLAWLISFLCPAVLSVALSSEYLTPEVPWKKRGLPPYVEPGCVNGPSSRACWKGGFSIFTNVDTKWPSTGKLVKVVTL